MVVIQLYVVLVAVENGHVEVAKVLLEVGGRDLAMLVMKDGSTCFHASGCARIGFKLEDACTRAGMSRGEIAVLRNK